MESRNGLIRRGLRRAGKEFAGAGCGLLRQEEQNKRKTEQDEQCGSFLNQGHATFSVYQTIFAPAKLSHWLLYGVRDKNSTPREGAGILTWRSLDSSLSQGSRMLGLIEMNLTSAGKPHRRNETPSFFLNVGANDAFLRKGGHFGF
jgi:hypothetical protein